MIVLTRSIKEITSFISESKGPFMICQQDHLQDWKFVVQSKSQAQVRYDFGFVNCSISGVRGFEFLKDFPGTDWEYLYLRGELGKMNGWKVENMTNLQTKLPCHLAHLVVKSAVQFLAVTAIVMILVALYRSRNFAKIIGFPKIPLPS
jgi:hypothetical protein